MLEVIDRPIASLKPYARNPRKNDAVVERMVASIREFGFRVPMLIRGDGTVIDGHLRLKAAVEMGMDVVPCILCDDWTEGQVRAFRLMANRSVSWATWDGELLAAEISDLNAMSFDLALTGFDSNEIDRFLTQAGMPGEDTIVAPVADVAVQRGDLWRLGKHRLLCGDAESPEDVARLLDGVEPGLMVTDPPYGVDYDPAWRTAAAKAGKIAFAVRREGKIQNDDRLDWSEAYRLFAGDIAYLWHADRHAREVQESLESAGFEIRCQIIWAKSRFAISRGHYHWQHEPCWYAIRKGATGHWRGDHSQTTLWQIASVEGDEAKNDHGTQKPVECMRRPIINHTNPGQAVYDPFVGSGTTIIAAETIGRVAYAMDIDPVYVDVAIRRWQEFTGQEAVLEDKLAAV